MKKYLVILISFALLSFTGCADDAFGHETYTDAAEYAKIFDLSEVRYDESALELFPESIDGLNVKNFFCEWELGIVGSAKVEIELSVTYDDEAFTEEISRLSSLGDGEAVFDTENFELDGYVSVLGFNNTSYYALVDTDSCMVHYVLLQLIDMEDIDIDKDHLPKNYWESGEVEGVSYNIYA